KETDVFDVWFDSACTNLCVYEGAIEEEWTEAWPPDLFLEGSDQHRGWFNVSLIVATALKGEAPYREVITHGMVLDGAGQKMSKRLGNALDPEEVCNEFGADILRLWVAGVNYHDDVPCSREILKACGENYRRIRNTLRFLLGNLSDHEPAAEAKPTTLDRWITLRARALASEVIGHYRSYSFNKAIQAIQSFCTNEVSAVYADAIKDRMYCDGRDWPSRRAAQHACHEVLMILVRLLAPILPHTAEEVYGRIPGIDRKATVHLEEQTEHPKWTADEEGHVDEVEVLLGIREKVFAQMEAWRTESGVKDSQDVEIDLTLGDAPRLVLKSFGSDLAILFKAADVRLHPGDGLTAAFRLSDLPKCDRSRLRRADVQSVEIDGETYHLTDRDRRALGV
ncbi:MAG: class I tRNA ligase family protein, partial [Fimbriimonadaceae bacterium]|nr:class I tRNA ligase family protein [Fimbriimonadaceae bacterium]